MEKLYPNEFYHIYNRGNNSEKLFYQERNYDYFLKKYDFYLSDYLDTYVFCLMPNHFHFLIRVKTIKEMTSFKKMSSLVVEEKIPSLVSEQFRKLFVGYTMAINKQQQRHGALFERPFQRKRITDDSYLKQLVRYIHQNPIHHGFVKDISNWSYSSYNWIINDSETKLKKEDILAWFDGKKSYQAFQLDNSDFKSIQELLFEA